MKNFRWIGAIGIPTGIMLNQILGHRFGVKGPLVVIYSILALIMIYMLFLMFTKKFLATLVIFIMILPLIIGFVGMYTDNLIILEVFLGSIIVVYPLFIIWIRRLEKKNSQKYRRFW